MIAVKLALLALFASTMSAGRLIPVADDDVEMHPYAMAPRGYWQVPSQQMLVPGIPMQQSTHLNVKTMYAPHLSAGMPALASVASGADEDDAQEAARPSVPLVGQKQQKFRVAAFPNGSGAFGPVDEAIASPAENKLAYATDAFGRVQLVSQRKGLPVDVSKFLEVTKLTPAAIAGNNGVHYFSLDGNAYALNPGCTIIVRDARVFKGSKKASLIPAQPWGTLQLEIRCPADNAAARKLFGQ